MRSWFQNLNENKKYLFHFRGSLSTDNGLKLLHYELCQQNDFRFEFTIKNEKEISLSFGLLLLSVYLTIPFFTFNFKNYSGKKLTGFYFYDWTFVTHFMADPYSSSNKDPWYRSISFNIPDFLFGRRETLEDRVNHVSNLYFKIGDKEFKMDSIEWKKKRFFRRYIPYVLYHQTYYAVEMDIKNPPMISGKGENSWDCGDDATYGLYAPWKSKVIPSWNNQKECAEIALKMYTDGVLRDAKKYGGSESERGIKSKDGYTYIGFRLTENIVAIV